MNRFFFHRFSATAARMHNNDNPFGFKPFLFLYHINQIQMYRLRAQPNGIHVNVSYCCKNALFCVCLHSSYGSLVFIKYTGENTDTNVNVNGIQSNISDGLARRKIICEAFELSDCSFCIRFSTIYPHWTTDEFMLDVKRSSKMLDCKLQFLNMRWDERCWALISNQCKTQFDFTLT